MKEKNMQIVKIETVITTKKTCTALANKNLIKTGILAKNYMIKDHIIKGGGPGEPSNQPKNKQNKGEKKRGGKK